MSPEEHSKTKKARKILKDIFTKQNYCIEEEVPLPEVTNNMGESIIPPYQADMILSKEFIIELDSRKLHETKIRRIKDRWRNINIRRDAELKTVRLLSQDILKQSEREIVAEIEYQLKHKE